MTITFFGSSDYCLPILECLHSNFDLNLVITRPDKPMGRHQTLTPSPVKLWAQEKNIPIVTPTTLKKETPDRISLIRHIKHTNPDLAVVSDYGLIIPETIFKMPLLGTIDIHFSRLPDLRGPSPVQFTLLRGDTKAWITVFKLANPPELEIKMDSGPIIWQKSFPVSPTDTTQTLYTKLFNEVALSLLAVIKNYQLQPTNYSFQDHSRATFCRFLTREDGFIEWKILNKVMNSEQLTMNDLPKIQQESLNTKRADHIIHNSSFMIHCFFRAVTPWPGMFTLSPSKGDPRRMIIRQCHLEGEKLILDQIQFEGKKPQPATKEIFG